MNNSHILELSAYTQPEIVEDSKLDYVTYGSDDEYYNWLIERFRNSPTNNAIINSITRLMYGRGLYAKNASKRPNDFAQMLTLFRPEDLRASGSNLYMLGNGAYQVAYNNAHNKILKVKHIPQNLLRPEKCDKDGNINAWYYSDNWEDIKNFPPKRIPVFGTSNEKLEVKVFGAYSVGRKYFSSVAYEGCLDYCVLEERIAEYLINEVENGFSGTKVINFNNGVPTEEQQKIQAKKVLNKLTGSRGQKVIVSFNNNQEQKTTVDDIPLNDAPDHYNYLSTEARNKVLAGHSVTSSMLVGITPDGQGFSSNADEIEVGAKYFHNVTIKPQQDIHLDAIAEILAFNNISLDLFFRRLNLFEDIEADTQKEEEVALSSHDKLSDVLSRFGEDEDLNEWELIDERDVDYDNDDDLDLQVAEWEESLKPKQSLLSKVWEFVNSGVASPNQKSSQDKEIDGFFFKVRYVYDGNKSPERDFCKLMMQRNKLYRKEDIMMMSETVVNEGFGEFGTDTYDIFKYKGGPRCGHKWVRKTYVSATKSIDVKSPNAPTVSTNKAEKFGYVVRNPKEVAMKPNDMPLKGFSPNNTNLPSDVA